MIAPQNPLRAKKNIFNKLEIYTAAHLNETFNNTRACYTDPEQKQQEQFTLDCSGAMTLWLQMHSINVLRGNKDRVDRFTNEIRHVNFCNIPFGRIDSSQPPIEQQMTAN